MTKKMRERRISGSVQDILVRFAKKAPALDCQPFKAEDIENQRPLASGEKERLFRLLSVEHDEETRCAAAYVIGKLGLTREAGSLVNAAYLTCEEGSDFRFMLSFAAHCIAVMEDMGTTPPRGDQLPLLLEMRESVHGGERRFAEIVLDKADIKSGTLTSW